MTLVARHDSRCPICDEQIVAGEHEITDYDGEWVHADCAEEE